MLTDQASSYAVLTRHVRHRHTRLRRRLQDRLLLLKPVALTALPLRCLQRTSVTHSATPVASDLFIQLACQAPRHHRGGLGRTRTFVAGLESQIGRPTGQFDGPPRLGRKIPKDQPRRINGRVLICQHAAAMQIPTCARYSTIAQRLETKRGHMVGRMQPSGVCHVIRPSGLSLPTPPVLRPPRHAGGLFCQTPYG
jgi:hypothetical protein